MPVRARALVLGFFELVPAESFDDFAVAALAVERAAGLGQSPGLVGCRNRVAGEDNIVRGCSRRPLRCRRE